MKRIFVTVIILLIITVGAYYVGIFFNNHLAVHFQHESEPSIGLLWLYGVVTIATIICLIGGSYQIAKQLIK